MASTPAITATPFMCVGMGLCVYLQFSGHKGSEKVYKACCTPCHFCCLEIWPDAISRVTLEELRTGET